MKKILFYSFKGGSGRTTALANVAVELAKKGKNVLCVDLDIEGPGLNILFGVAPKEKCLEDYLRSPQDFELSEALINVGEVNKWDLNNGSLFLIPASGGVEKPVNYAEDHAKVLLDELFDVTLTSNNLDFDYILLDSPSGFGDMSAISITIADFIIVLFKWSKQHLMGTVRISAFFDFLTKPFSLVASSVPEVPQEDLDYKCEALEATINKKVDIMIPENNALKWDETILSFEDQLNNDQTLSKYRCVSDLILNIKD